MGHSFIIYFSIKNKITAIKTNPKKIETTHNLTSITLALSDSFSKVQGLKKKKKKKASYH